MQRMCFAFKISDFSIVKRFQKSIQMNIHSPAQLAAYLHPAYVLLELQLCYL